MAENTTLHLNEISNWIDRAFGEASPAVGDEDMEVLSSIFTRDSFDRYMRDQVNRQIIRDYLTNAVVLGVISEGGLAAFAPEVADEEGRSVLALYMLMSSVEEAKDLPLSNSDVGLLKPLTPEPGDRSHIKLVPN